MNDIIESIITKAKNNKKTIVLPEGEDDRILEATTIILPIIKRIHCPKKVKNKSQ